MDNRELSSFVLALSGGVGRTKESIELSWLVELLLTCHHPLFFKVPHVLFCAVLGADTHHFGAVLCALPHPAGSVAGPQQQPVPVFASCPEWFLHTCFSAVRAFRLNVLCAPSTERHTRSAAKHQRLPLKQGSGFLIARQGYFQARAWASVSCVRCPLAKSALGHGEEPVYPLAGSSQLQPQILVQNK